jgi:hypothetical protein
MLGATKQETIRCTSPPRPRVTDQSVINSVTQQPGPK